MSNWNLFRKIKNKYQLKRCLKNLNYIIEYQDPKITDPWIPKIDNEIIESTKQILSHINSYMPIQCIPTYRNSIQLEWENKNKLYMEFEIEYDQVKCMIMPYFGDRKITSELYNSIKEIAIKEAFNLEYYNYMNQIIEDFMNGKYDEKCKLK